jgi:CheY-like chemotaxis protein
MVAHNAPLRVLVVEDDPDVRQSFADLLRCWGHQTVLASDGVTALRVVEEQTPDVILLDLGLPHMNGLELAKIIRGRWPDKPPVLIAVTGYGTTEDCHRSNEAGIDFHLLKPVEPDELECILAHYRSDAN